MRDADFVRSLGNWREGAGPAYRRLADAVQRAIETHQIAAGGRVPAERALAKLLGVSRTTVVAAYERLRQELWLESRQGSGTRARRPDGSASVASAPRALFSHRVYRVLSEPHPGTIEFLGAHLSGPGFLEKTVWAGVEAARNWKREPGYFPLGLPELRRAIALHLTRGRLPTSEDQVLVTSGAQQAIALAASLWLRRGDPVVIEDPTYLGGIDIFHAIGAKLLTVPVERDGVSLDAVREAIRKGSPRLLYLMPTYQNPTGAVLPEKERRKLARLSEELQIPIVEDDTLIDLSLKGEPPPPLAAFSPSAPILTIGSLSKLFWGGLRIGWIRASEPIISQLAPIKTLADLGSSVLSQAVAIELFRNVEQIRQTRRRELSERLDCLSRELAKRLPSWSYERPMGGLSLWVRLPQGSALEFSRVSLRYGVSVLPGNLASPEGHYGDYLRVPFVLDPEVMTEGVARLARAWEAYAPVSGQERGRVGVLV